MTQKYDFKSIEKKWRPYWQAIDLYQTGNDPDKPDIYILDYFPYPSGQGLSVGHCRNYVPTCIAARYKRMAGYNVLHPMGWDAFGLPAENYAVEHGVHPRQSSQQFAATYKRQLQLIECSYDWSREINSTDPAYYRWTQHFFLLLFQRGLAYQAVGSQWWCPRCQTILANEQVEQGRCWRCDAEVTKKELRQWYFKITEYADRLLADLETIQWPERIQAMQRHWIGRSEGVEIVFQTEPISETGAVEQIKTFTTRADTLFGVTFIAIAPEHPLLAELVTPAQATAVGEYSQAAQRLSPMERQAADRNKNGVFTGSYAIHPFTGRRLPIWVADYVLMEYGSGAVMGVPGHDVRDDAFAQQYDLPIVTVISPDGTESDTPACFTEYGLLVNSGAYTGMRSQAAITAITADLEACGRGQRRANYKLHDWLISRQRYWGAPIPIIHCPVCGPVAADLPVLLPETVDFAPAGDGRSPLARVESWLHTSCPQCGGPAQRETDTMDGFACSSWYFLRFTSPQEATRPFNPAAAARWLPVDIYVGGAEHAVMHLLYARFWTKVMYDAGLIAFNEPFTQLKNQGVLMSPLDGRRMSKSRGNVVTPDEVAARFGVDALRLYVVFLGPFEADVTWDDVGIRGMTRFLERYYRLVNSDLNITTTAPGADFERQRHQIIKRVTQDMEGFRFNTAVAILMEYLNYLVKAAEQGVAPRQWRTALHTFTILLAPFAPFITEEVWQGVLGQTESVHRQKWPVYDEALTLEVQMTLAVQVNGKVRGHMTLPLDADEAIVRQQAPTVASVRRFVDGRAIQNIIVIPNKLVNIVV